MLSTIAYLSLNAVEKAFKKLADDMPSDTSEIISYFVENCIGVKQRNVSKPPLFDTSIWNVNELVKNDFPRTNNSVEGYHNKLQNAISCAHPTIFKFLEALEKDNARNAAEVAQSLSGHPLNGGRKPYGQKPHVQKPHGQKPQR